MTHFLTFVGRGYFSVLPQNPEFNKGMRGAYSVVAGRAENLMSAIEAIEIEFSESCLSLRGFDYIFQIDFLDRQLSEYEVRLIERLDLYPVQFENVHYFPGDS